MQQRMIAWSRAWFACVLLCVYAGVAHALPENGWWWNAEESGRGYFIEVENGVLFMAAYLYDEDGRATWLVSGGPTSGDAYTGRLLRVTGGQTLFGAYRFPAGSVDAGEVTLAFSDQTHGTLTWPGGITPIERQVIGVHTPDFDPTGWWWNPDESGRGFSVEVRGTTLFMAGFMYDDAGNPVWYISSGPMSTATHYEGALLQIGGGQTLGGPYQAPTSSTAVGTVAIDFQSLDDATFTFSDAVPAASSASPEVTRKKGKVIEFKGKPQMGRSPPPAPPVLLAYQIMFEGPFLHDERFSNLLEKIDTSFSFDAKQVRWVQASLGSAEDNPSSTMPDLGAPGTLYFYLSESSSPVKLVVTEQAVVGDANCSGAGTLNRLLTRADGFLWFNPTTRRYQGEIHLHPFGVVDWKRICQTPSRGFIQKFQQLVSDGWFKFEGTANLIPATGVGTSWYRLKGTETPPPQQNPFISQTITGNWDFQMVH